MTTLTRERNIDELKAEIEALEFTLAENPAREFIRLVPRSGKLKGELEYITVKQYRDITGNIPRAGTSKDGIHIPYNIALDTIAEALGYSERSQYTRGYQSTDLLKQDIESALKAKHQIAEYKQELKYIESEVSPMPEHTDTPEKPQNRTLEPFDPIKADAAAKDFRADLTAILNDGNRATDLCNLFSKYYLKAGHKRLGRVLVTIAKGGK